MNIVFSFIIYLIMPGYNLKKILYKAQPKLLSKKQILNIFYYSDFPLGK